MTPEDLYASPNALAPYYSRFRVSQKLLLTGHSHQAWPDCSLEGQRRAWLDAAEYADRKWQFAFAAAEAVRRGFAELLNDDTGLLVLGPNTHELVVRFLSALPLRQRPKIVTTDGEFHSLRRQLDRLAEEGIEVVKVASLPACTTHQRLIDAVDGRTSAVMVSSVLFRTGHIVGGLGEVMQACRKTGARLLVDAYHSLNAVPFSLKEEGLEDAFVVGGGYKYCQLGEGNCFLRFPQHCDMRPVVTGWYAEFEALGRGREGRVFYGSGPERFAGATYDPTSHYRGAAVFEFFKRMDLTPRFLREVSQHQTGLLARMFDDMDFNPRLISRDRTVPLEKCGGFLMLHCRQAEKICCRLKREGVYTDFRQDYLRLGPAPYLSDLQLERAMRILEGIARDEKDIAVR